MAKDHSDSEKGNLLPSHGLLFPINSKGSFICTIPDRIAHTTTFVTGPFHGICEVTSKILKSEFDQNTKCIC